MLRKNRSPLSVMTNLLLGSSLCFMVHDSTADAEEYTPPAVPKLYQKASPEELAEVPVRAASHFFVGGGVTFGQSRSTGGESPLTAYGTKLEFGYNKVLDSWSRLEMGMTVGVGAAGHSKADLSLKPAVIAHIGYGYSLGGQVMGIVRGGVGALFADYEDDGGGVTRSSTGTNLGTALQLAYGLTLPMSQRVALHTALSWTHLAVQIRDVTVEGRNERINKPVVLNVPSLELGLRVAI